MRITSTAPMRVDLAGGTLDIYPLYVFENGAYTINAAVGIRSRVVLETRTDGRVIVRSRDLGVETAAKNADSLRAGGPLDLVTRVIRYYRPSTGIQVTTENSIPKGSGLGASSALLIALSHALIRLSGRKANREEVIDVGANIEAQSIRVPTGKQDYYPASYGGLSAIHFGLEGVKRMAIRTPEGFVRQLEGQAVLSFVGEPRFSGATNWEMMRAYVDGNERTVESIRAIKRTAAAMKASLEEGRWDGLVRLLREEWRNRMTLAPGVTNPQIDDIMEAVRKEGAMASKLCGAGGGGCMITLTRKGMKAKVEECLKKAGVQVLPFRIERQGVAISVEE